MTNTIKRRSWVLAATAAILLVPLIIMQFTDEVSWTLADFVIAAILLVGTGLIIEWVTRRIKQPKHKIAIIIIMVTLLLLIWAELAVGIFGTPLAGS